MATTSARLGMTIPAATDNISGFPAQDAQALGILDNAAMYFSGTLAARSSLSSLVAGTVYKATDTGDLSVYDGSGWNNLVKASQTPSDMTYGAVSVTFPTTTVQTSQVSFAHNLGRTPAIVLANTGLPYNYQDSITAYASWNATSITVWAESNNAVTAGTTISVYWLAIG